MLRARSILWVLALGLVAGIALAQEAPTKNGTGPALKAQPKKANQPETFGTTNESFYRMGANEFTGMQTGGSGFDLWNDTYYSNTAKVRRYGTTANAWFIGTPHLPSGALVTQIDIQDCVNNTNTISGDILRCDPDGDNCTVLTSVTSIPGCGFDPQDISGSNFVINNSPSSVNGNYLVIRLQLANTDGTDSIAGAVVHYKLTVSPAPASPTFNDVQPGDFGYQWIEALVASGITGGCQASPPLYCPNDPLTRAQMAVFLAKALGLQWQ